MKERPLFVVVEDGTEYTERFTRFFGGELAFVRAGDLGAALAAARGGAGAGAVGLLLDLDFRRTPADALVDETGRTGGPRAEDERRRLSEVQGILILRALREAGVRLPALLFADLDDRGQIDFITRTLAPVRIVPSSAGLAAIRDHFVAAVGSGF